MTQAIVDRPRQLSPANVAERSEGRRAEFNEGPRRLRGVVWLVRQMPTVGVMLALAGLGAYGHHSDWKLPKFSTLTGNSTAERDDWCEEHGVPESQCVECDPDLLPRGPDYGWCQEHGVHNCPLEHPDMAQWKTPQEVTEADRRRAAQALIVTPRRANNALCKNHRRRIQFASAEAVKKAGLDVALVDRQPLVEAVAANGQITYDQTRFASLSPRLSGTVWQVMKNVGDRVQSREVLALVDAAEVGRAKMELIQALAQEELTRKAVQRLESLTEIVPGRQLLEAQAAWVQARARLLGVQQSLSNFGLPVNVEPLRRLSAEQQAERLRWLGVPEADVQQFSPDETTANLLPVRAPLDGIVVARQAVAGEVVDASRILFQLADTSRMWLTLSVSVEDVGRLALGQPVRFRADGGGGEVRGTIVWISTTADRDTRMVSVRAELPNPQGQLRNETFGAGQIVLRDEQEAVVVPNEAVHWEGCCQVVFVRDRGYFDKPASPKVFHVRTVRLGAGDEKFTEIIAGVLPGEVVAAQGSDVLRAELLKNSLGEGCCAE